MINRLKCVAVAALALVLSLLAVVPAQARQAPEKVLHTWYRMVLELVRHTPTFSPPVASRAFAYLGVTGYEIAASAPDSKLVTLAGQLNGLNAIPARAPGQAYDEGVILNTAMAITSAKFFSNTGPTGHRALSSLS